MLKTLTLDNGSENTNHKYLTQHLNLKVFFCHPYHSWEKGTVENTIGRIRRYLPKGTDLNTISVEKVAELEYVLNNTPRKCLGYLTPYEKLSKELAKFSLVYQVNTQWCTYILNSGQAVKPAEYTL